MRILLLGGTAEARRLEAQLHQIQNYELIVSLAGRTRASRLQQGRAENGIFYHVGGFGGIEGLQHFLVEQKIDAVIDATHPFARQISWNSYEAAKAVKLPLIRLNRPPWTRQEGDQWQLSDDLSHAVDNLIPGKRYLLAIGRQEASLFANRPDCWFLSRSIEPLAEDQPRPPGAHILFQPNGDIAHERAFLQENALDGVICKNSGGESGYAKLIAARQLGLIVHMIERPIGPDTPSAYSVEEVRDWLCRLAKDRPA
ncbi:MAG: cobalt-precorrin-6A reductase [Cohaesibacter sp.]|nr:cobalt-precorrin-6A reductase [Cohaesibacter sp.]